MAQQSMVAGVLAWLRGVLEKYVPVFAEGSEEEEANPAVKQRLTRLPHEDNEMGMPVYALEFPSSLAQVAEILGGEYRALIRDGRLIRFLQKYGDPANEYIAFVLGDGVGVVGVRAYFEFGKWHYEEHSLSGPLRLVPPLPSDNLSPKIRVLSAL